MSLGKEIKKARIEKGLKQKDLQEMTGLSQKYLSQIENDAVDPRASILRRIAQALKVSADILLQLESQRLRSANNEETNSNLSR